MSMGEEADMDRVLVAYADGELGPEERRGIEERLETDPVLRERLAEYQGALDWLRQAVTPPPAIGAPSLVRVRERVRQRKQRRVALAVGATVVTVALALVSLDRGPAPVPAVSPVAVVQPVIEDPEAAREELAALRERIAVLEAQIERLRVARDEAAAESRAESVAAWSHREEVAAIAVAAGANLEASFGDVGAALQRYRYVVEKLPDTAAAEAARAHIARIESAVEL